MNPLRTLSFIGLMLCACIASAQSQWQRLTNSPPDNVGAMLLLTDGTVLAHQETDIIGNLATTIWYKLTPDINGSYVNGTWTQIASLPSDYCPLYFASAVLPDSRMIVEGGEDNTCSHSGELGFIYDPVADTWTAATPPFSLGDAPSTILSNGTFMLSTNYVEKSAALLNISNLTLLLPAIQHAGLRRFRIHDLRHTFASLLIQDGASLAYVKEQLGHSTIAVTVDLYGHLVPSANIAFVDRLDVKTSPQPSATQAQPTSDVEELEYSEVFENYGGPGQSRTADQRFRKYGLPSSSQSVQRLTRWAQCSEAEQIISVGSYLATHLATPCPTPIA